MIKGWINPPERQIILNVYKLNNRASKKIHEAKIDRGEGRKRQIHKYSWGFKHALLSNWQNCQTVNHQSILKEKYI